MRSLFLIVLVAIAFVSCKKETDDNLINSDESYRIKKIIHYSNNNEQSVSHFDYEGEKLIRNSKINNSGGGFKYDFLYEKNKIIITRSSNRSFYSSGNYVEIQKDEYLIDSDGNVNDIYMYSYEAESWVLGSKFSFQYQNNKIVSWLYYGISNNGEPILTDKFEYIYDANKLVEYRYFSSDDTDISIQDGKLIYSYDGERIKKIEGLYLENGNWKLTSEVNYFYSEDKISSISMRNIEGETQSWITNSFNYIYDDSDNLVESIENNGERSSVFEYEKGTGNAGSLFFYLEHHFISGITKPRLKSATIDNSFAVSYAIHENIGNHGIFQLK